MSSNLHALSGQATRRRMNALHLKSEVRAIATCVEQEWSVLNFLHKSPQKEKGPALLVSP